MNNLNRINILIFGSLPQGKGGMETIIETTQSIEGNLKFDSLFFTFHGVEFCDKRWRNTVKKVISPTKWLPRILQEYIVVKVLRAYVYRQNVKVIVCTDEKACKLAAKARGGKNKPALLSWLHRSLHTFKHRDYFNLVDVHIAIAKEIATQINEISNKPTFVINNCVSLSHEYQFKRIDESPPSFIYVGRIEFEGQKRLRDLITAFSLVRDNNVHLQIIGDGADISQCIKLCEDLHLTQRVHFYGWKRNPWEFCFNNFKNVVALCLTSSYEGFPMVLIEAISQGIFCISSNCSTGPKEIINEHNGFLYSEGNITELSLCMEKALKRPHGELYVNDRWSKKEYIKSWEKVIFQLRL